MEKQSSFNNFLKRLKENSEYYDFWQDFHKFCNNFEIPDKKEFVESLPILFERIKNDMSSYSIYEALKN